MELPIATLTFYLFSITMIASALAVISVRNPVHSVLFLIFCFFNAAGLFVLLGAEYIAMTLVIVYVGAVAVLFLFVVMMLNVDLAELRQGFLRYLPVGLSLAVLFFIELYLISRVLGETKLISAPPAYATPDPAVISNTEAIGRILYTDYVYAFQLSGVILLVAMIGAIVLTLREKKRSLKQNINKQLARKRSEAVELKHVNSGREPHNMNEFLFESIGVAHYQTIAALLFVIGICGIFLNRKNIITLLMSIELMLLAVNINMVVFSAALNDLVGQVFTVFILTVAAAEAAIGLAILVTFFRNAGSIAVEEIGQSTQEEATA